VKDRRPNGAARGRWGRDFMTHGSMYYIICQVLNKVLQYSKLRERSNKSAKERKQRGRAHWWWRKILTDAKRMAEKIKDRILKIEEMRSPRSFWRLMTAPSVMRYGLNCMIR
jgi:hypothetical protein